MQAANCLGKEIDSRLHDVLRNRINKYLTREEQTIYKTPGKEEYHKLQINQNEIGCDNFIRGKFYKHWRIHQRKFTQKNKHTREIQEINKVCMCKNRTPEEEEEIRHKIETQNRRLPTTIRRNHQHCTRTMA